MRKEQVYKMVDVVVHKYLIKKVREKYSDDFHLLEPIIDQLVSKYTLKDLFIVCATELTRIKNGYNNHNQMSERTTPPSVTGSNEQKFDLTS